MSNVYNKVTREYIESADTVDYLSDANWVINPDISAVDGIDASRWIVDPDNSIREMTESEYDAAHAPSLVVDKIEKMTQFHENTKTLIAQGFLYDGQSFSLTEEAQGNWTALTAAVQGGMIQSYPLTVSRADGISYELVDATAVLVFGGAALAAVQYHYGTERVLVAQVWAVTTKTALDAIEDNR